MHYAIRTDGLSKRYARGQGVQALDLAVPEGSIYAFLGLNGAGKTTTIRLLLGLISADAGSIEINGSAVQFGRRRPREVGATIEAPSLYPHLSGRDNLRVTCLLLGLHEREAEQALHTVGLLDAASQQTKRYSLGMRQRLGLAQALLGSPRLLLLDEPSNGLDPTGMAEMRELIRTLARERGVTVFVSSHLLEDVEKIATHVGLLHQGRLQVQGELASLQREQLYIETDAQHDIQPFLLHAGLQTQRLAPGQWLLDQPHLSNAQINRLLVEAGFDVHALHSRRNNLEQFFMAQVRAETVLA